MKRQKDLNWAQAKLIGFNCYIWSDASVDDICVRVNKWIVRHPILAGFIFAGLTIIGTPFAIVRGFIAPADDMLEDEMLMNESSMLSNEAIRKNREDEA